jgi:glycosyltransferase involved in cell wall biosynthesis
MMNVIHITRRYYPFFGGVETYIQEISRRLSNNGINSRVLTLDYDIFDKSKKASRFEIADGTEVQRLPGFGHYKKPIPLKIPLQSFKWADIVHIHDLRFLYETTLMLKNIYKYKVVLSTHGFILHTRELEQLKMIAARFYFKPTIRRFIDHVICVSKQDYRYFSNWDLRNIILFENPINFRKYYNIRSDIKRGNLLYFGRIDWNKGCLQHTKHFDWRLDIVGPSSRDVLNNLKSLSAELGISDRITWHGFLEDKSLFKIIREAHICFFPSTYEGFGFTLVEAMAPGKICVANSIDTYSDIVDNDINGIIVDFNDTVETAKKIEILLGNGDEYIQYISNNAIKKAKKYSWSRKIGKIIDIYDDLLRSKL